MEVGVGGESCSEGRGVGVGDSYAMNSVHIRWSTGSR